jgi:CRISPR-associated protein Csx10
MDLRLTITAEAPLAFSDRKPGGVFQRSLPYVPGSALRGALAAHLLEGPYAAHREDHPFDPTCDFCRVFLGPEAAIFTNAYPVRDVRDEVQALPATAASCKRKSGFSGHGVFDTLVDRLCWEALEPAGLVYNPTCPLCRSRVKAWGGFYVCHRHGDQPIHYHQRNVDQRLLTRVAINRRRMVAEEGLLYSPYVISEMVEQDRHGPNEKRRYQATAFVGYVWGLPEGFDADQLEQLKAVGGRSSQGLGHVSIQAEKMEAGGEGAIVIEERVAALDKTLAEAWEHYQRLGGSGQVKNGLYFSLSLRSDAVLRTLDGLPTMVFDAAMLAQATGIKAELVHSFASFGYGGGWQSAWGLPKPSQVLTRAGSVYVFRSDGLTQADYQALARLEVQGIGDLAPEGYGQVRVSDAFHLKRRDV